MAHRTSAECGDHLVPSGQAPLLWGASMALVALDAFHVAQVVLLENAIRTVVVAKLEVQDNESVGTKV
mgnify:CR=1 FL=1